MPPLIRISSWGEFALQLVGHLVAQRRNLAVFLGAQPLQDRIARMNDKGLATGLGNRADEIAHEIVMLDRVDADPVLDGDRHRHRVAHGPHAVRHQLRLRHQAGAKRPALDPLGRATAIQVDLGIAPALAQLGRGRQIGRLAAAQLQGNRLLGRIEVQMARDIAMQQRTGRHHLGVQPGVAAQLAMEGAAVAVRPVHHGSNGNAPRIDLLRTGRGRRRGGG
ncbi:hypothetical protein OJJOAM_003100 [Cupriavidus sp. H18C1]